MKVDATNRRNKHESSCVLRLKAAASLDAGGGKSADTYRDVFSQLLHYLVTNACLS